MERPSDSINSGGADNSFENLYVYGKLNYDFNNDDITINSINVNSNATFTGDINLDEITCRNANVTGVATVTSALYVQGKFFDGDGDFGTAGQLLSSDGTDTVWIDASTTSVANANNVGTNADSTNADQFVTFVGNSSGNNPIRVDAGIKYNPSTNRLTAGSFAGDGSALTGVESFVTGMIILWSGSSNNIPSGFVLCNGGNNTPDLRSRFVIGASGVGSGGYQVGDTGGAESVTLTVNQIPAHTHTYIDQYVAIDNGYRPWPASNNDCGQRNVNSGSTGGGLSHENRPPFYALCYIMKT
jgi:hypothetical protein